MFTGIVRALTRRASGLPGDVAAVLEAANYSLREGNSEDEPRVIVVLAGGGLRGAFAFEREDAERRIKARWPELSTMQIKRAATMLEAGAMKASRVSREVHQKSNFVNRFRD